MAIVAVARELGFPVYLAATAVHVYAKWHEPNGYTFNIEAANPAGMVIHPDEYYRDLPPGMTEALLRSGYYLRPLTVTDELALCMISRGWVLEAHGRYDEASLAHAHACRLAPIEPMYPRIAARCVGLWLRESFNARVSEDHRIRCKGQYQLQDLYLDPQRLLPQEHLPLALTILAAITKFRENSVRLLRSMRLRVACIARIVSASPVAKTNAHGSAINQSSSNANM
jgi:hypothetical protein